MSEAKRAKIRDIRERVKAVKPSVSAQHEYFDLLIESTNDLHDSILILTDLMGTIATAGSKRESDSLAHAFESMPVETPEPAKRPWLDLRGLFGKHKEEEQHGRYVQVPV
jgi:predicted GTPase